MNFEKDFYITNISFVDEQNIDVSFLPPMARRKLSLVDKAALCAMNKVYNPQLCAEPEIIFASQYGELDRLDKIILQYQEDNEVSPFTFSTSVHNCIAGQFSLLHGIKKSYNALASGENTFSAGLLESFLAVKEGSEVLYCFADAYKAVKACALIISNKSDNGSIKVSLAQPGNKCPSEDEFFDFKEFWENKKDVFTSFDKLFSVCRGNK